MKKITVNLIMLIVAIVALTISGCKKESTTDDSVAAGDAANISSALSSTSDDADNAMSTNHAVSGKTEGLVFETFCGASVVVDSNGTNPGTATITYSGTDCSGKLSRTGTVTAQLLNYPTTHWKDAGATLVLTYDVSVTVIATGLTYKITGTHNIENVNGGLAYQVMDGLTTTPVVRKHTCNNATITFPDGSQRLWSFNRTRTFSNTGSNPTITMTGDSTVDGIPNVAQWGTNRNNEAFYAAIPTPISSDYACNFFHPTTGEYLHHVANRTVTVMYGVNLDGTQHTGSGCAYGYQMTYTKGARSLTAVFPY
jgi:hypothetical protein